MSSEGMAFDTLDEALFTHRPVRVVPLISGGDDSRAMLDVVLEWLRRPHTRDIDFDLHVAHIDTGTGIPETQQFVTDLLSRLEVNLHIYRTPAHVYEAMVKGWKVGIPGGFPGPGLHHIYYSRLKDRRIDDLLAYGKSRRNRTSKVMFLSGIRQQESSKRMGYDNPVQVRHSQVWVNPLFAWSKDQVLDRLDGKGPRNPASERMHISGECLCGCYARPNELEELRFWFPHVARRIDKLTEDVHAEGFHWNYGEFRNRSVPIHPDDGFMPLCATCEARQSMVEGTA